MGQPVRVIDESASLPMVIKQSGRYRSGLPAPHLRSMSASSASLEGGDAGRVAACAALEAALRVRAPAIHASTAMVRRLSIEVAEQLGLDDDARSLVDLAAQVRDIGMIALPDSVLLSTDRLSRVEWELMSRHPILGSELLAALAATAPLAAIVRSHHERWDGEGYPAGLAGEAIPMASRVIAVCDAYVAIANDRPHRRGLGEEVALDQIRVQRGRQFDPEVIDALLATLTQAPSGRSPSEPTREVEKPAGKRLRTTGQTDTTSIDGSITRLDTLAAFAPARERLLADTAATAGGLSGATIAAVESDIALTVTVLRNAQPPRGGGRAISNVPDAVAALGAEKLHELAAQLPAASFPWQTRSEALLHHARVHAQAVARSADQIARIAAPAKRDDVLAVALLHDVGKLVLAEAGRPVQPANRANPEDRSLNERRTYGTDHASLGSLLASRWRLPRTLARAVGAHHTSEDGEEIATLVRLADMVAHLAQGTPVDRRAMLRLARAIGISASEIRDVLFDLPHSSGSQRRRIEPSPLSVRETDVLRLLAQGQLYKQIAQSLTLSTSTIRSHLHNIYEKLDVPDRAQAVLRATEMAWI